MILDEKLSFVNHIKLKIQKTGIKIDVIKSLCNMRPQQAPLTIYKSFIRLPLEYGDLIYN